MGAGPAGATPLIAQALLNSQLWAQPQAGLKYRGGLGKY